LNRLIFTAARFLIETLVVLCGLPEQSLADFTSLDVADERVTACQDYFTSEWANPLDMNESDDILNNIIPREVQQLHPFSFANGIFSTIATGDDPYFRLLTWVDHVGGTPAAIPDSTTRFGYNKPLEFGRQGYRTLSFRMYSDIRSFHQIVWEKLDGAAAISAPLQTYPGWHTYTVDLATTPYSSLGGDSAWISTKVGALRFDPIQGSPGSNVKFDWIQLTKHPSTCPVIQTSYTALASDLVSLFLDDNTDPTDGSIADSGIIKGSTNSHTFNTSSIFPGDYKVYGIASKDFASLNGRPWDMDDSGTDVDPSYISGITRNGSGFSSGKFCGTTNTSDANFTLAMPARRTIDTNTLDKLSIRFQSNIPRDSAIFVWFFDQNRAVKGVTAPIPISSGPGYSTYQIDLSAVSAWTGEVGFIRIDPPKAVNISFCVDWVSLSTVGINTEPLRPTPFLSARNLSVEAPPLLHFIQPDREGGEDFFATVRGRPSDMSSVTDIQHTGNLTEAWIYPGSSYLDSSGALKTGDFFQGVNQSGNGDPTNFSVFVDRARPIDPDRFKITCFTLDVLLPVNQYHSVARVLWQQDSTNINGDDIVVKTNGESRYCVRMDTLQLEPPLSPGAPHPWRKNSDGTGINYWRVDAHEEESPTAFRIQDIRLAADHTADNRFLVVIDGSREEEVTFYYSSRDDGTGGQLIGTLPAHRQTDSLLWDTTNVAEGTWFVFATVGSHTFPSPHPVVVSHRGSVDSVPPGLSVDAPLNGHRFTDSIEIAGFALDNMRVATIEAFIDGQLLASLRPSLFSLAGRKSYPTSPFSSHSGFQNDVAVPASLTLGSHSFSLKVYDTAGNETRFDSSVEKVASGETPQVVYPIPSEDRVAVGTPIPPQDVVLSMTGKADQLSATISNTSSCSSVRLIGNVAPHRSVDALRSKKPKVLYSGNPAGARLIRLKATKMKSLKKTKKKTNKNIYLLALCDDSRASNVVRFNTSRIKKTKAGQVAGTTKFLTHLAAKLRATLDT
jgi:hypothetical protein